MTNYTQQCRVCHIHIEGTGEDVCYRCLQRERDKLQHELDGKDHALQLAKETIRTLKDWVEQPSADAERHEDREVLDDLDSLIEGANYNIHAVPPVREALIRARKHIVARLIEFSKRESEISSLKAERDQANTIASDAKWQNERLVSEIHRLKQDLKDAVMLMRRMMNTCTAKPLSDGLRKIVFDWIERKGLTGSVLREGESLERKE